MVIQRQPQPLIIFSVDVFEGYAIALHNDAIGDGLSLVYSALAILIKASKSLSEMSCVRLCRIE